MCLYGLTCKSLQIIWKNSSENFTNILKLWSFQKKKQQVVNIFEQKKWRWMNETDAVVNYGNITNIFFNIHYHKRQYFDAKWKIYI